MLKHQTRDLKGVPFTREWDKLVTYVREFIQLKHDIIITEKDILGDWKELQEKPPICDGTEMERSFE